MDSLDWQYEDVINKRLFADNLEIIPSKFENDEAWRRILHPYILEDLRASVHASLQVECNKIKRTRIQFSNESIARTIGLSGNSGVGLEFQIVSDAKNQQAKAPEDLFGSLNILIRTGSRFEHGDSLLRTAHSFIYVKRFDDENARFQCSIFCKEISHFHSLLQDKVCDLLLIQVPLVPAILAIKHLVSFIPPPFFKDILTAEYDQQNNTKLTYRNSLRSESIETLNASQRAAVEQIMNSTDSATAFSPAVKLIHGPPGTGKTSTLISIIHTLFLQRRCTHITAPNNKAIRVLVEKYLDRFLSDQGSNLSDIVLVKRLEVDADHYLSSVTLTSRVKALKVAGIDLPKAISEVRGYLREFGLCRMYECMAEDEKNLPDFSSFCRGLLANSLDRIIRHLTIIQTQHPLLNRLEDAEKSIIPDLVARFSDWAANLETYFSDEMLITWQRDMDTEDCQGESFYRNLFSAIDSDISECYKLLDKLPLPSEEKDIETLVVQNALLVFSTVSSGASYKLGEKSEEFDVCIVDEATQLVEAFTAQVFSTNLQCLILAGDHRQLPATVNSQVAKDRNYERSLFDRLVLNDYPSILLDTQYRMHPDICLWPNHTFYANRIINGANVSDEAMYRREWSDQFSPVSIIDAADGVEKEGPNGISKCNELEEKLVRALTNDFKKLSTRPTTVGIISPYKAQVANLHDLVDTSSASFRIIVSTVDGCQGQEFDIVIFSAVRANANNAIGFLEDVRRLNVAITRPKFTLVVVCNVATVITDPIWRALVTHIDLSGGGRVMRESLLVRRVKQKYAAQQRILEELLSPSGYVFEKCSWKISFTGEFKDSIRTSSKRDKVILLLQKIGVGSWSDDENMNKTSTKFRSIIHISKVDNASRLIWSIDVQRTCGTCKQCIKVWGIVLVQDHSLEKIIRKVERGYSIYSEEYLARCMERKSDTSACGKITMVPEEWAKDKYFQWTKPVVSDAATARDLEMESLNTSSAADDTVAFLKCYELSSKVARILIKSSEPHLDLPFVMSEEEEEIVNFPGSVFVLGRSGTGKTTVMLHRMLMEQHHIKAASSEVSPRQIFVTASPMLCEAIKRSHENMRNSMAYNEVAPEQPNRDANHSSTNEVELSLESLTFDDISDSKFPLIITYKVFMDIMYNSLKKTSASNTFGIREHDDSNEIHFDTFRSFYYPHFPSEVTSNVDVKILYTEIRSVIKGSLGALASANGRLSKSQYTALSTSRGSELSSPMRELIYTAYEKYEQMKGVRKEFDMEDFVYFLYSGMERFGFHGRPCTSVFVDEVQDLSAAQIALFRFCCPNLAGFVMAGDTAQTISEGVGFRFEALKDVFFHQFLRGLPPIEAKNLTPHVWELTQNFRTHNGVLFIARKIVEMIIHFFPHSIDRMKPESSLVFGPKPIFLESQPGGDNLIAQLFNDSGAQTMVDFGAEQVILVRDENAKELIKAKSGQNALVITALESKGMEFDDVMIVNFFSSSPFKNEWRVIENFSSSDSDVITSSSRRRFDPMKHGILNTELKMLYVLVTRAKKRLIIADDDPCARRPMLDLLLSEGLIEMKYLDDDIRALFNGQSTSDEWIQKGDAFMSKRQYSNAKHCYGKGGDTFKEQHASASFFEQEGDRLTATDSKTSKECYLQSSELFRGLNKLSDAIRCYEKAKEYEQAAWIYESMNRWYDAGVCYEKVPTLGKASMVYWKCYAIPEALRCAYACHEYRTAIEELRRIPQHLQPVDYYKLMTECARKGALYFHRKKQLQEMMSCISSFPSTDSKRDFLKQYKYFDQVLDIELADECFENAAKIYLEMFEFKKASHFFHKAGCHRQARDNAIVAVRQSCLDSDRLRLKSQYSGEDIEEMRTMLQPSMRQSHDSSNDITLLELSLIESVASTNTDLAVELMRKTVSSTSKFSRLQLLAIFRAIDLLGTQIAIRWLEYWESIICLEKQLNIILPSLEKSISSQALSLLDRGNIDECAAFFEGKLTTKGFVSSVLLCAIPCTKVMFDICDESENRKSLTMTVSAFATVAAAYFRAELKTSCSALSRYLIGQLESISKLTPPAYIKNLEKDDNQPIMVTTKGRLELLVPLLQVLRVEEDKSTYNIAVTKLANLCFTEYSFLEDAKKVSEARISGGVVGECLKHFLTRFYNTKLRADMIVRCLLISELVGSTEEVATRLEKVCTNELRHRGKENEIDFRKLLVAAFLWEKSEHIPPNYELGPFLYSLDQGFTALDNDCWKGTIASCVYGAQLPVTAKQKDGCISPQLFLKLIEKYVVLTSSIRKNYTNVILPQSLFEDVLCRCNKAYCNDILSCDSSRASNDREKYSCELARRIFSLLESILGETPPSSYFAWFQANSISPLREEDVNLQSAIFVLRTITLLKTIIVNFTDLKLYDRYNKLSGKFDILSTLLDVLPTNLRKKLKTKTLKSTDLLFFRSIQITLRDPLVVFNAKPVSPLNSFIRKFKLLPKWIVVDSREYSISSVDEKPGAAASSTIPATEEVEEEEVVLESQAVEMSIIEEGRKEAEQTTLPPAKKEFPTPKMAYILKKRLKNARLRISNLNETEKFQRTTERQLVEIGTNRLKPNFKFYLQEVCPRLLVFAKLDLQVERFKSRADDEDVEIIDTLIVSQNTLQTAVENLNIRSPLPDTEEIKAALEKAEKIFEELHQFMSSELISERIHAADEREIEREREREQKKGRLQSEKSAAGNKSARANNNNPPEKKKLQGSATSKNSKVKK